MNYKNVVVPYLKNIEIEKRAELFRDKLWSNNLPVDIEYIIDIKLKINVIPVPGFLKFANIPCRPNPKNFIIDVLLFYRCGISFFIQFFIKSLFLCYTICLGRHPAKEPS